MTANAMAGDRQKFWMPAWMTTSAAVDRRLLESSLERWLKVRQEQANPENRAEPAAVKPLPVAAVPAAAPARAMPARPAQLASTAASAAAGVAQKAPVAPLVSEPVPSSFPILAMDVLQELESVMGSEYLSLIQLFLKMHQTNPELEQAAAENNIHGMIAPSHTLKSSAPI